MSFKKYFFFLFLFAFFSGLRAQQVGINILFPDSSAILHVESTDKGFLWPRMNTNQRDAIPSPAHGLTIFNVEDSTIQYWNGVCWLNTYQQNCDDCYFTVTSNKIADTIVRTQIDSTDFILTINQNAGNPQNIAFAIVGQLPSGMTVNVTPNPLFSSGSVTVTVKATPFTPGGTYPIVVQTLCGSQMQNLILSVTLTPCYLLNVVNSQTNYSTSVDLYATHPTAPTGSPVCVVVTVNPGVDLTSVNTSTPAFTTGALPPGSLVGLINNGNILGKGGDGGLGTDPLISGSTGAGFDGGNAVNLTSNAFVQNNFNIYGGGGGGSAAAYGFVFNVPQPPFPIPGYPNCVSLFVGAGGGGGAGVSLGGNMGGSSGSCSINLNSALSNLYSPGTGGTGGQFGIAGKGGLLIVPISATVSIVNVGITPNAVGGDGGEYGYPGDLASWNVQLTIGISVPVIGSINLINGNLPLPIPIPPGGNAGFAIKRNGFTTNIPDNNYNNSFLKGRVGP